MKKLFAVIMLTVCFCEAVAADPIFSSREIYEELDSLALEAGTDKSSRHHNYTLVYADYFNKFRNENIKFLEIGIFMGQSVKLWQAYFPNADLHFIDNNPDYFGEKNSHVHYHLVNQSNERQLNQFIDDVGRDFDIIIDDGGHTMEQQLTSFKVLFPALKSGGIYVIEDLHTSYWKNYGGGGAVGTPKVGKKTTTEFLKARIDDINRSGATTSCADYEKTSESIRAKLSYYQNNILSMHFYDSLCIIIKR